MTKKDASKIKEAETVVDNTPITMEQYKKIEETQNATINAMNAMSAKLDAIDAISFAALFLHSKRSVKLTVNRVKKMQADITAVHESMAKFRADQMELLQAKAAEKAEKDKKNGADKKAK